MPQLMEPAMDLDFNQPLDNVNPTMAASNHSADFINGIINYNPPARTTDSLRQSSIEPWVQTEASRQKKLFDNAMNSLGNLEIVDEESPSVNLRPTKPLLSIPQGAASSTGAQSKRDRCHERAESFIHTNRRGGDLNRPLCNNERRKKKQEVRMRNANNPQCFSDESGLVLLQHPPKPSCAAKAKTAFVRKLQKDKVAGYVKVPGQHDTIGPKDILIVKELQALQSWATPEEELVILKRNHREARSLKQLAEEKADSGKHGACKRVVAMARQFWAVRTVELARVNGSLSEKDMDILMEKFGPKGYQAKQKKEENRMMKQLVTDFAALWYGFIFLRFKDGS